MKLRGKKHHKHRINERWLRVIVEVTVDDFKMVENYITNVYDKYYIRTIAYGHVEYVIFDSEGIMEFYVKLVNVLIPWIMEEINSRHVPPRIN